MPTFYADVILSKNQIKDVVLHKASADLASPVEGQVYYNTTTKKPKWYDGTAWSIFGTVSSVSVGNLSPLFTSSVATSGTTPAVTFTLSNAGQNLSFMGPASGGAGAPSFRAIVQADLPSAVPVSFWSAATADVSMGSFAITNLKDPVNPQDAATMAYVDAVAQGLSTKLACRVATTGNITLSGTQTIDGIAVAVGNRVLVKDQTTASQNGIYIVASGAWTRATDANAWVEIPGSFTFIQEGTVNADNGWVCISDQGGTLNTTAINYTQFSGAGQITAGSGLTKSGNTLSILLDTNAGLSISGSGIKIALAAASGLLTAGGLAVNVDGSTVELSANAVKVKNAGITHTHISSASFNSTISGGSGTTIGVVGYTFVSGTTVCRKYSTTGSLATGAFSTAITHNLGTKDVVAMVRDASDNYVMVDCQANTINQVTLTGNNNTGAALTVSVVVIG